MDKNAIEQMELEFKEKLKKAKEDLRKKEKEEKEKQYQEERRKLVTDFSEAVKDGMPIYYGDDNCNIYKVFDKESLRLLKSRSEVAYIAIDRERKIIHPDSLEKVMFQFLPYELNEILPLAKNGKTDREAVMSALPICKIDFDLEREFEFEKRGFKTFNLYTPPTYLECQETEDISDYVDFLEHLFPVEEERRWTLAYLREALVGRCISKQLYLVGDQGVGKGFLYDTYKTLFSDGVVTKGSPKTLDKQFKPDLSKLRLLYIDEFVMKEGDLSRAEARAISEEEVSIEQKFFDEKTVKSRTSFILSSNEISKLCFTPSERRPLVPRLTRKSLEDRFSEEWIDKLKANFEKDSYKKSVYEYLLTFPKLPRRKIHTRYLELITLASASKPCAGVINSVLLGKFQKFAPDTMHPLDKFVPPKFKRRGIKDSTMGHWLANFIWKGKKFFKYDAKNPFHITWLGCPQEFIDDYSKDISTGTPVDEDDEL